MASDGVCIDEIIHRCQQGDRVAQKVLFDRYRQTISRLVVRMLGTADTLDVQDTIQQAYIALFRSLPQFRGESTFDTWVYRICNKVIISHIRKKYRKRKVDMMSGAADVVEQALDPSSHTNAYAEQRELARELQHALGQLDADRRSVLVLYEMEGKSLEEIARMNDVPLGTIKSRLFRARKDMCRLLVRYVGNSESDLKLLIR